MNFCKMEQSNKEMSTKMFQLKTNVPELDRENAHLFSAADILESLGNYPGLTANTFYAALLDRDIPSFKHEELSLAAIAIETMMSSPDSESDTIH